MNPPRHLFLAVVFVFGGVCLLPIFYMIFFPIWARSGMPGQWACIFERRQLALALNSVALAGGTTVLSLVVGVPLALLISRTDLWLRKVFSILYFLPVLIPAYIHAIVWTHLDRILKKFFLFDIHTIWGAILVLTLAYFPFVTLMTVAGLKSIDRNLEEASLVCYGRLTTLGRITLPLTVPHIISGAIFVFIFSIIDVGVPDILRVKVFPLEIFIQFSAFYNESAAAILSMPLICITFMLIALQKLYMKGRSYVQIQGGEKNPLFYSLGRCHPFAILFCLSIVSLSAILPVIVLFIVAGSLSNYVKVMSTSIDQIAYSFVLAFLGAAATLLLGFAIAYLIERSKNIAKIPLSWAVFIPLAIPATTLGIGFIGIWNRVVIDIVYASSVILVLGYVARFVPYATIIMTSGMKQVNPRLEEAAALSGARWARVIGRIVAPLSKHNLMVAFFIVFILAFGELGTTLLIIPPGRETIPIKIYNLMHYGADQKVAALCLIIINLIICMSGIFLLLKKYISIPNKII